MSSERTASMHPMATVTVSSGVTSSGLVVSGGNLLEIDRGGTADTLETLSGARVVGGGVVDGASVNSGATYSGVTIEGSFIDSGGALLGVTERHGDLVIGDGGEISAGKLIGGSVLLAPLATMTSTVIEGALVDAYGVVSGSQVGRDGRRGLLNVFGSSVGAVISGGAGETIHEFGAATRNVVLSGGSVSVLLHASDTGTRLRSGGSEYVDLSGFAAALTVYSGGSATVAADYRLTSHDLKGVVSGASVLAGGVIGGTYTFQGGFVEGLIEDHGVLSSLNLTHRGDLRVYAGGSAADVFVFSHCTVNALAGSVVTDLVLYSGSVLLDNGIANFDPVSISGATGLTADLDGTLSGRGLLYERGDGVLTQAGDASAFDGVAIISGGVIDLANATGFGKATIKFDAAASTLTLQSAAEPASGDTFAETLFNFDKVSEGLDLEGQAFVSGATATLSGHTLTLVDGGYAASFTLRGTSTSSYASSYLVTSDGTGGTLITPGVQPATMLAHAMARFGDARSVAPGAGWGHRSNPAFEPQGLLARPTG